MKGAGSFINTVAGMFVFNVICTVAASAKPLYSAEYVIQLLKHILKCALIGFHLCMWCTIVYTEKSLTVYTFHPFTGVFVRILAPNRK